MKQNPVVSLFKRNNGYLTRSQLPDRNTYEEIREMIKTGKVERIKNGLYFMEGMSSRSELVNLQSIVNNGVLCMNSAWFHYELTVEISQAFHVAIEKSRKVTLPQYPFIELYYWQKNLLDLGVSQVRIDGVDVRMYDMHKSVCDAVKFRAKIGTETFAEILKNYLKRKDRNLVKLIDYAKVMRVENILKTYLEVQL
jgi:predicted transcriptional regulator of viral defense system